MCLVWLTLQIVGLVGSLRVPIWCTPKALDSENRGSPGLRHWNGSKPVKREGAASPESQLSSVNAEGNERNAGRVNFSLCTCSLFSSLLQCECPSVR